MGRRTCRGAGCHYQGTGRFRCDNPGHRRNTGHARCYARERDDPDHSGRRRRSRLAWPRRRADAARRQRDGPISELIRSDRRTVGTAAAACPWFAPPCGHRQGRSRPRSKLQEIRSNARRKGIETLMLEAPTAKAVELAFARLRGDRAQAIYVASGPLGPVKRARIIALATDSRLPVIYSFRIFAIEGGLISFAADYGDLFRRAAG